MFYISDDKDHLQFDRIKYLLKQTYWANRRSDEVIKLSIENSLCAGVYLRENNLQIGFARVITDYAATYYLCDVIIDREYRGIGAGKALVEFLVKDERLKGLRGILATGDAHGLYEKFGFSLNKEKFMES